MELTLEGKKQIIHKHTFLYVITYKKKKIIKKKNQKKKSINTHKYTNYIHYYKLN